MDISEARKRHYMLYHLSMMAIGDCDPAYPALDYLADRFELNREQRYWLAFLYQSCYCVPTVYYMYSEFPDYENVDVKRMVRWWDSNKKRLLFQTDRLRVRSNDAFVPMFESYRDMVGDNQNDFFTSLMMDGQREYNYNMVYDRCGKVYYIGRYSLFLYLESLHRLIGLSIYPTGLDLRNAESCRNGLCYALGLDSWVDQRLENTAQRILSDEMSKLVLELQQFSESVDYWNVETSLCAYKKLYWKARYLGYYIDRLQEEIITMQKNVTEGVDWSVMWDFRSEYFDRAFLGEFGGWKGVRKELMGLPSVPYMSHILSSYTHHKKVYFEGLEDIYEPE